MLKNYFSIVNQFNNLVDVLIADAQYLIGWQGYDDERLNTQEDPNLHFIQAGSAGYAHVLQLRDNEYWIVEWYAPRNSNLINQLVKQQELDDLGRALIKTATMPFKEPQLELEFKIESGVLGMLFPDDPCFEMEKSLAEMRQITAFKEFAFEDVNGDKCCYHLLGGLKGKTCRVWTAKDVEHLEGEFGTIDLRYRLVLE